MKYARIVNNKVFETFTPHNGVPIEECFTPELVSQFIECPDNVQANWDYDGITFIEPVIPEAPEVVEVQPLIEPVISESTMEDATTATE